LKIPRRFPYRGAPFVQGPAAGKKKIRYWADAAAGKWMSVKNKKQFGIWMDNRHATVIGHADAITEEFSVLGHADNPGAAGNSNENAANNLEKTLQNQFFKKITSHMQNAEEVHVTGTGTVQEQFIHYLAETPQFKNTVARECTSNRMSDERLVEFISAKFN
jgi:stalled ribosome rescue protein Dom34